MSTKDVFGVLSGSVEPVPAITASDTPDTPANLVEIKHRKQECDTLFFVLFLVASAPASTQYEDRNSSGGRRNEQKASKTLNPKCSRKQEGSMTGLLREAVNFRMEEGKDPDDYFIKLKIEIRGRLHEMRGKN